MLAYLQVLQTSWDAFKSLSDADLFNADPVVAGMRRSGSLRDGFWEELAGFQNVNMIGTEAQLDAVRDYFAPNTNMYHKWGFDGKVNFSTEYTGQHNDILTLHKGAATFENPNWAHGWYGQKQNRFAREFSREFGEDFS